MKRVIFIIALLLVCLGVKSQTVIKYTTSNLNLRTGEGTEYKVITVIPKGTPVKVEKDCDCEWIPVSYNGHIGYISGKYLSNTYKANTVNYHGQVKYYTNSKGERVQSPTYYNSRPAGATALCRDGTYSFSRNRRGTCSHHGGVAIWF